MSDVVDVDRFYADLLEALEEHARRGGTGIGAAAVVKRIAVHHGVGAAARLPLPRLPRAVQAELGVIGASWRRANGCG